MARPLRIEYPGAHYHIYSRGIRKENIYINDQDRSVFLEKLRETIEKFTLYLHSYVLMNNHYHLYLETPGGNISRAIHYLNTSYTNWLKAKYSIIGPIFQGRYKSILVEKEVYALTLSAYIHLNPVRAGLVNGSAEYLWSSFRAYIGLVSKPRWLTTEFIINEISGNSKKYQRFVENWQILTDAGRTENMNGRHSILGTGIFEDSIKKQIRTEYIEASISEQPELKHLVSLDAEEIIRIIQEGFNISRETIFRRKNMNIYRRLLIYSLKRYSSLNLKEIGAIMNMRYTAITENVRCLAQASEENIAIKDSIERCDRFIQRKIFRS
ncbi:transposase [Acidobacteriota bacterium]